MKECLNCKNQYQERRSTSKFCSNKCRSAFYRKGTKGYQESIFEKILTAHGGLQETLLKIKQLVANTPYNAPSLVSPLTPEQSVALHNVENKGQVTKAMLLPKERVNELIKPPEGNEAIKRRISEIKQEKIPKERDTINGRKAWALDQKKRIEELEKQLK